MKNSDSNLILYAKGHYEENDLWKDLAKILGERNLLEESYLNKQLIFENVVSITLDYIGTSQTKIFELMREIQPSYFWRWRESGDINFEKNPDDYDFYYASVRKCLSLLSTLPVIGKNDEILIELDSPDYSILPISENALKRKKEKENEQN